MFLRDELKGIVRDNLARLEQRMICRADFHVTND